MKAARTLEQVVMCMRVVPRSIPHNVIVIPFSMHPPGRMLLSQPSMPYLLERHIGKFVDAFITNAEFLSPLAGADGTSF